MTIKAASEKVNMSYKSGKKYYRQYLTDQKRDVPTRIAPASQKWIASCSVEVSMHLKKNG